MSPAAALYLLALPVVTGWGLRRIVGLVAPTPVLVAVPVFGAVAFGLWGLLLSLADIPWSPLTLLMLPVLAATAGCLLPAPTRAPDGAPRVSAWDAAAAAGTLLSVSLVAVRPAAGWDFRYIWGLKAEVYALARGIDVAWLSWFPNISHHPHYPPLWSVLLAEGTVLGFDVSWTGSVLSAGCLAALAGTCWWAARRAHPALRMLAALAGAAAPSLADPRHTGYAEPLLALLVAAGLSVLAELQSAGDRDRRGLLVLFAVVLAAVPLVKVEGTVLAVALLAGAALTLRIAAVLPLALSSTVTAGGWLLFVRLHHIPVEPRSASLAHMLGNRQDILDWVHAHPAPWLWPLVVIWVLALVLLALRSWRLAAVVALWAAAVAAAYLTTLQPAAWQVATSLPRVLSVPLPAVLAILLGGCEEGASRS